MRRVVWTDEAAEDLAGILAYIAQFNPLAAQRLGARLIATAATLSENAERGRSASGGDRELTVVWPYILRYHIDGDAVVVYRCRHGAREPD